MKNIEEIIFLLNKIGSWIKLSTVIELNLVISWMSLKEILVKGTRWVKSS